MPASRLIAAALIAAVSALMVGCPTSDGPPPNTEITSFEVTPSAVPRGASVRLSWVAINAGAAAGVPSCSLTRRYEGADPEDPFEVACTSSLEEVPDPPLGASYVRYQLNVLKRSRGDADPYVTSVVTVTFSADVSVDVEPPNATLTINEERSFSASVTGTSDTSVTWSATCGTISGSGSTVSYTAPGAAGTCTVTATSAAHPTVSGSSAVTVTATPVEVTITPDAVTLPPDSSVSFMASVLNTTDERVTWQASCGTLTGSADTVQYRAPGTAGTCLVTATSLADPRASASATVTITDDDGAKAPASYVSVSNVRLVSDQTGGLEVRFDISWPESWRGPQRPTWVEASDNWDAAWVFLKYRLDDGPWRHATLRASGHRRPGGVAIDTPGDSKGAFVYRDAPGYGDFGAEDVGLLWDVAADGVSPHDGVQVQVRVFALEMVYVSYGSFHLGSGGTSTGEFRTGNTNAPYPVTSQSSIALGSAAGQLNWTTGAAAGLPSASTSATFPTGYGPFYVMKYQITQGQYVDFLNTLTQAQADGRKHTGSDRRHAITGSVVGEYRTALPHVGMNYLGWADAAAFSDWAALRPLTELEYEKVARGPKTPNPNEGAWGNTTLTAATGLSHEGTIDEVPSPRGSNAVFGDRLGLAGPVRVGSFAAPGASRTQAGASFYGALDLSGNLWERTVTVGHSTGRAFTGEHGDGALTSAGNADVSSWPSMASAAGSGLRGGSWFNEAADMRVSNRRSAADAVPDRFSNIGARAGRTAP